MGRRRRPHLDPPGARRLIVSDDLLPSAEHAGRVRHRFRAALDAGPGDGGRRGDVPILCALAEAPVSRVAEVLYGSNAVFILELDAGDPEVDGERMRAIYKPVRGERPLWDFPRHTLHMREVATYLVDAALDLGHVPPTVLRDGPLGPGSLQLYVHALAPDRLGVTVEALEEQLRDVAALDVLVNNADRKRAHLLVTSGPRVRAIDNALTFLPYPRQRTALIALGGSTLPEETAKRVRDLAGDAIRLEGLLQRLRRLLSTAEVDAFAHRLQELADDPVYPVLDDWDGRPFEWW